MHLYSYVVVIKSKLLFFLKVNILGEETLPKVLAVSGLTRIGLPSVFLPPTVMLCVLLDESGLLVHCISGWDRTPLFVSLLRLSLWAVSPGFLFSSPRDAACRETVPLRRFVNGIRNVPGGCAALTRSPPAFVSQDGAVHASLEPAEILYLTIAYDWFLFG